MTKPKSKTVRKVLSPTKKTKKVKRDDVFGVITHAEGMQTELVILKSKAIAKMIKDGMDEEEAEEFWEYNIAGSYGSGSYSCVDDTLELDTITEMLDNDDTIVNPPYTGRPYIAEANLFIKGIETLINADNMTPKEKIKALKQHLLTRKN